MTTCFLLAAILSTSAVTLPPDIATNCETWLCAGQSNMQQGWGCYNRTPEEQSRVRRELAQLDAVDVRFWNFADGSWSRLNPTNALAHSAIGVSFAIRRAQAVRKPIAILYVAAGGAPTEAFLSKKLMSSGRYPTLAAMMRDGRDIGTNAAFPCKWVAREYPLRRGNPESGARWWNFGALYEKGIAPLAGLPLTGILWYQGESNATDCTSKIDYALDAGYMRETLRAVVEQLRGERRIPLLMFGLPRLNRPWEPYRTAQREVCRETGAVYIDTFSVGLGDLDDVHPRNKIPFAVMAAEAAAGALSASARVSEPLTLWCSGEGGVACFRIPALATAPNGDLIAACDARLRNGRDLDGCEPINIAVRRSSDGGRTWTPSAYSKLWPWTETTRFSGSDPSLIVDRVAGKVFLFCNVWEVSAIPDRDGRKGVYRFFVQESSDNGATWGEAREITRDIAPADWPVGKTRGEGAFIFVPSGSGTQLADGTLLHTIVRVGRAVALFGSSDHGRTWRAVGRPTQTGGGDECKVAELADGRWMINQRWSRKSRFVNVSADRGETWQGYEDANLADAICNGQLMRSGDSLLLSNCVSTRRENVRLRRSDDDGRTWDRGLSVCAGPSGYSDITELSDGRIGVLYEDMSGGMSVRFLTVNIGNLR